MENIVYFHVIPDSHVGYDMPTVTVDIKDCQFTYEARCKLTDLLTKAIIEAIK